MRPWLALTGLLFIAAAHGQTLQEAVTAVWVHDVPGPPQGDFWHPVAEHLLSSFTDPASIYPNVEVCVRPLTVASPHCTSVCWEFKGDTHGNGQPSTECQRPLRVRLVPNDPRMLLEVIDMERAGGSAQAHAIIVRNIEVPDPSRCPDDHPCKLNLPQGINTARGTLALSFSTQMHGVLGASPSPSSPTVAAPASGGSATPGSGTPAWQTALDWARNHGKKWAQSKDPTANARETAARAAADTQAKINSCLATVAHSYDALRQRMPACAGVTGRAFEQCMYTRVLYDDNVALTQGYSCSRQYQDQVDTLARTGVSVWLKSKICGIGMWIGLKGC